MRFPPNERISASEAAQYVGVTLNRLAIWRMHGIGPPYLRIGTRRIAYRIQDLDNWIAENSERAAV